MELLDKRYVLTDEKLGLALQGKLTFLFNFLSFRASPVNSDKTVKMVQR